MISESFPGPTPEEQIGGVPPAEEASMQWEKDEHGDDVLVTDIEKFNPDEEIPAN